MTNNQISARQQKSWVALHNYVHVHVFEDGINEKITSHITPPVVAM